MSVQPTIISYRSQSDLSSHFLNVDDLVKSVDFEKIKKIYDDIFCSVTAYDPNHVKSFIKVENRLYKRIVALETEKKEEIEKEIQKKTTGWKAIVLAVLTLGIGPLVFVMKKRPIEKKIKEMSKAHSKFSRALNQMKQRILEKELHPKPKVIQELEKKRLNNLDAELIRLKSIPRIAKSLEKIKRRTKNKSSQVAFGRSLELQEQLKDTHYVINHGQNLNLMLVNIIARKLKQKFEPIAYESFEPLRHDTALRHIKEDKHIVTWYQKKIGKGFLANDHYLRKELICGDCVLESTSVAESALDFFLGRTNIAVGHNFSYVFDLLHKIVQDYIPNQEVARKLCSDLVKLMDKRPQGGNLYSICVPKKKFDESCYFSGPLGIPLQKQEHLRKRIELMQSGEDPCGYPQIPHLITQNSSSGWLSCHTEFNAN